MKRVSTRTERDAVPVAAAEPIEKAPFDIHQALPRIAKAVEPFPKAALFELAEEGYRSVFEQLAACMISIRTRDEVTLPTARRLFAVARTPAEMLRLSVPEIDALIRTCTFHEGKAAQIHTIARRTATEFDGDLPCDFDLLTSFSGVGPKCAGLALGIACGAAHIGVDVHVWRVTNRWGIVAARTPEQAIPQLEAALPREYWVEINRLLVPFGKHVCTGTRPKCSTCPLLEMCRQVGVDEHR